MKSKQTIRLQKILAQTTNLSRRAAERAILNGEVFVNGERVTKLGTKADPFTDKITYCNKPIKPFIEKIYLAFNKPKNTIVSKSDPQNRPLIWDFLPRWMKDSLNSCGRLDFDSEGLIILTNDGELINKLTKPSGGIWKTYLVKVRGKPEDSVLASLRSGVGLEDGPTLPSRARIARQVGNHTWLEIAICEGRNRQLRRMCATLGHPVIKLRRIAIGRLKLGSLRAGTFRLIKTNNLALDTGNAY